MKNRVLYISILVIMVLLTFFATNYVNKKNEEERIGFLQYFYKNQIFVHELSQHNKLIERYPDNAKLVVNSFYHVNDIVERFKILSDDDLYDEIKHDYVVFLYNFSVYLKSINIIEEAEKIDKAVMGILNGSSFSPRLKIDYVVNDVESLGRYVRQLNSVAKSSKK